MPRFQNDSMLDAALNWIKDNTTQIWVLSSGTTSITYDNAKTWKLAGNAIASTAFALAAGDVSGRKTTVAIVSGVSVTTTGDASHLCLVNTTASSVTYLTEASTQTITAGNSMNTGVFDIEIEDSSAP